MIHSLTMNSANRNGTLVPELHKKVDFGLLYLDICKKVTVRRRLHTSPKVRPYLQQEINDSSSQMMSNLNKFKLHPTICSILFLSFRSIPKKKLPQSRGYKNSDCALRGCCASSVPWENRQKKKERFEKRKTKIGIEPVSTEATNFWYLRTGKEELITNKIETAVFHLFRGTISPNLVRIVSIVGEWTCGRQTDMKNSHGVFWFAYAKNHKQWLFAKLAVLQLHDMPARGFTFRRI